MKSIFICFLVLVHCFTSMPPSLIPEIKQESNVKILKKDIEKKSFNHELSSDLSMYNFGPCLEISLFTKQKHCNQFNKLGLGIISTFSNKMLQMPIQGLWLDLPNSISYGHNKGIVIKNLLQISFGKKRKISKNTSYTATWNFPIIVNSDKETTSKNQPHLMLITNALMINYQLKLYREIKNRAYISIGTGINPLPIARSILLGGIYGTVFSGPVIGTVLGAAVLGVGTAIYSCVAFANIGVGIKF